MIESNEGLYQRVRPKRLEDVVGQPEAVKVIQGWVNGKGIPHAINLSGDSGTGKTTTARILRTYLECSKRDFTEINCAEARGIDTIREIQAVCGLAPMSGKSRIWLLDEAHRLTSDAQSALLKTLEDTPSHAYFFLATTDPQKLLPTIRTRCADLKLKAIDDKSMSQLLGDVAEAEGIQLSGNLIDKIIEVAEGSARKALVLLEQIAGVKDEEDRISIVLKSDLKKTSKSLVQALLKKADWKEVAEILKGVRGENPESLRRGILEYATSILLNGAKNQKAVELLDAFQADTYSTGFPGLVLACGRYLFGE